MRWPTITKQVEKYLAFRRAMGFDLQGEGYPHGKSPRADGCN